MELFCATLIWYAVCDRHPPEQDSEPGSRGVNDAYRNGGRELGGRGGRAVRRPDDGRAHGEFQRGAQSADGSRLRIQRDPCPGQWDTGQHGRDLRRLDQDQQSGDRDSIGVFQLRVGIWGYTTAHSPALSADWFLRRAIAKQNWYSTSGRLAQAVEVSGYPYRYDQEYYRAKAWLRYLRGY